MKILAIRFSGMGDVVMLTATLRKLKSRYPDAHITLLTDSSNVTLQKLSCGVVDEVWGLDRNIFRQKRVGAILGEIGQLLKRLRTHSFDMVIDFQNFGESAFITFLSKASIKRGAPKRSKYHYAYTHIVPRDERGHRSQFFHRIAGVDDALLAPKLCLSQRAHLFAKKQAKKGVVVGLNIGSTQESRRWSEEKFLMLAKHLRKHYDVWIFLGPLEKRFEPIFEGFTIIKDVDLEELAGAVSRCDYFVSNDTGPVHMAAALGVPTLTLFSTGTDENVGAIHDSKVALRKNPIDAIEVAEVLEALDELIVGKEQDAVAPGFGDEDQKEKAPKIVAEDTGDEGDGIANDRSPRK